MRGMGPKVDNIYIVRAGPLQPGPCACLHSICVQNLFVAHSSAVNWRLAVRVFWLLMWVSFCFPASLRSWALFDDGSHISLAHSLFPLFLAMSFCYSCCNSLILLGLFWVSRLFVLLMAWHGHWFAFTCGLLCPFWLSLRHIWPVCFLWISSALLLILHSHELFY